MDSSHGGSELGVSVRTLGLGDFGRTQALLGQCPMLTEAVKYLEYNGSRLFFVPLPDMFLPIVHCG